MAKVNLKKAYKMERLDSDVAVKSIITSEDSKEMGRIRPSLVDMLEREERIKLQTRIDGKVLFDIWYNEGYELAFNELYNKRYFLNNYDLKEAYGIISKTRTNGQL